MTVPKLLAALKKFLEDDAYYESKKKGMASLARPDALNDIMMLVEGFEK